MSSDTKTFWIAAQACPVVLLYGDPAAMTNGSLSRSAFIREPSPTTREQTKENP